MFVVNRLSTTTETFLLCMTWYFTVFVCPAAAIQNRSSPGPVFNRWFSSSSDNPAQVNSSKRTCFPETSNCILHLLFYIYIHIHIHYSSTSVLAPLKSAPWNHQQTRHNHHVQPIKISVIQTRSAWSQHQPPRAPVGVHWLFHRHPDQATLAHAGAAH